VFKWGYDTVIQFIVTGQPCSYIFSVKAYYMIFEIPRKRPNECDTQGMKQSYSKLSHKKTNNKAEQ